jgi:hypothetical protein
MDRHYHGLCGRVIPIPRPFGSFCSGGQIVQIVSFHLPLPLLYSNQYCPTFHTEYIQAPWNALVNHLKPRSHTHQSLLAGDVQATGDLTKAQYELPSADRWSNGGGEQMSRELSSLLCNGQT